MGLFGNKPCRCMDDVQRLQNELKTVRLEWEEVQDKVYRWMQRTRKRERDAEARTNVPDPDADVASPVDPVTARILARRMRGRNGVPPVLPIQG